MCGLAGCVKKANAGAFVSDSLERLSYRGYDSFGWSVGDYVMKRIGKFDRMLSEKTTYKNLEITSVELLMKQSGTAICHTRWATNGEVNLENTHPIQSFGGFYQVVHNGIFSLTEGDQLDTKWYIDKLELMYTVVGQSFVKQAYELAEGDNCLIIKQKDKDELWLVARGTKCLYISDLGFVASDVDALSGYGKYCIKLSDCVLRLFKGKRTRFYLYPKGNDEGIETGRVETLVKHNVDRIAIPTGSAKQTTMFEEIGQQEQLLSSANLLETPQEVDGLVYLIGCGSSFNAALFGEYCINNLSNNTGIAKYASEFANCRPNHKYYQILISQSGETKDILGLVQKKPKDTTQDWHSTVGVGYPDQSTVITNSLNSTMATDSYSTIDMGAGPEFGVAATKTFTMTCLRLLEIASGGNGHISEVIDSKTFKEALHQVLTCDLPDIRKYKRFLFLGSGINFPIVREGALKMKEVSYLSCDAMPANEIKHGPISQIDEDTMSIVLLDPYKDEVLQNVNEIKSRDGAVLTIGTDGADIVVPWIDNTMYIASKKTREFINSALHAMLKNIILQRLAHDNAVAHGHDPNFPKNLSKSVTV